MYNEQTLTSTKYKDAGFQMNRIEFTFPQELPQTKLSPCLTFYPKTMEEFDQFSARAPAPFFVLTADKALDMSAVIADIQAATTPYNIKLVVIRTGYGNAVPSFVEMFRQRIVRVYSNAWSPKNLQNFVRTRTGRLGRGQSFAPNI